MDKRFDPIDDSEIYDLIRAKELSEQITCKICKACYEWLKERKHSDENDNILEDLHDDVTELLNAVRAVMTNTPHWQRVLPLYVKPEDLKKFATGVDVLEKDGVYKIVLPLLIPRKFYQVEDNYKQFYKTRYVNSIIWFALDDFLKNHKVTPIKDAALLVIHTYTKEKTGRALDHDNIELKHCIDRIAGHLIVTDSPFSCELHQMTERGVSDHSTIYVMSQETARKHLYDVPEWDFTETPAPKEDASDEEKQNRKRVTRHATLGKLL